MIVHTTCIEQFRRVLQTDYAAEGELIEQVKGTFRPNDRMRWGSAWHKLLDTDVEHWPVADDGLLVVDGVVFDYTKARCAKELAPIGGVREVPWRTPMLVEGERIALATTFDRIIGHEIIDGKTKFSTVDPAAYETSLQWRFYLWISEATSFQYQFWHFGEPDRNGVLNWKDLSYCRFYPYPGLAEECMEWLTGFVQWAKRRGLFHPNQRAA
jgi:hypothetical protein